jgi:hypothetical protein
VPDPSSFVNLERRAGSLVVREPEGGGAEARRRLRVRPTALSGGAPVLARACGAPRRGASPWRATLHMAKTLFAFLSRVRAVTAAQGTELSALRFDHGTMRAEQT